MTTPALTVAESAQSNLRRAVIVVEKSLSELTKLHATVDERSRAVEELRGAWLVFRDLLALEPEPERRDCPFCGGPVRLHATRCVHCWTTPLPEV